MNKLTIDRSKWYRGDGHKYSRLLIADVTGAPADALGKMCCLGFACLQLGGKTKEDIADLSRPEGLENTPMSTLDSDCLPTTNLNEIVDVNDDPTYTEEAREAALIELFAKENIAVKFL